MKSDSYITYNLLYQNAMSSLESPMWNSLNAVQSVHIEFDTVFSGYPDPRLKKCPTCKILEFQFDLDAGFSNPVIGGLLEHKNINQNDK